jgi:hypothetical protein
MGETQSRDCERFSHWCFLHQQLHQQQQATVFHFQEHAQLSSANQYHF